VYIEQTDSALEVSKLDVAVRRLPKSQVELTLSLTAEEVNKYFHRVYRELSLSGQIRGFRPGKAPPSIVRRFYGEDRVIGSVWMEIAEHSLSEALEAHPELRVIGEPVLPDLSEVSLKENEPVSLPVILTVYPTVTFGELKKAKLVQPVTEVSEQDVDDVILRLREEYADWVEVSRAIAPGDRVTADVVVKCDGEEEILNEDAVFEAVAEGEEGSGEDAPIMARILGRFPGQTVTVPRTTPETEAGAKGTSAGEYVVKIKKVEEKRLPEVNDEFAAKVGALKTAAELRERVREELAERRRRRREEVLREQAMLHLVANADMEVPAVLEASAIEERRKELESALASIGSSLDELAEIGAVDRDKVQQREEMDAVISLEVRIAVDALAESIGLEPEEEDIEAEIAKLARETRNPVDFVRGAYEVQQEIADRINNRAKVRRVLRWIVENAEIEEVPWEEFDERYQQVVDELVAQREERRKASAAQAEQEAAATSAEAEAVPSGAGEEAPTDLARAENHVGAPGSAEVVAANASDTQAQAQSSFGEKVGAQVEPETKGDAAVGPKAEPAENLEGSSSTGETAIEPSADAEGVPKTEE
jgi:trigger factor